MKQRIVTGVLGGAGFFLFLWLGGWWYTAIIIVLAILSYREYCRMKEIQLSSPQGIVGLILVGLLLGTSMAEQGLINRTLLLQAPDNILTGLVLLLLLTVVSRNRVQTEEISYLFLGSLYIGFGFSYMLQARMLSEGLSWSLLVIVMTFANDSGAYFIGRKWGSSKLWPSISPNKTVEGALGGLLCSIIASGIFVLLRPELGNFLEILAVGLLISIVGQIGDLVESAMKRSTGTKDSGTILPGHGGVLDRFDSLLLIFPVLHLLHFI
ncbi:phosphatidate cytidylyltransferase [Marininema mesophilum]|uniref:Phosphatidate cytidylyltransferase n=1 Tax=Marininema mesophilum TaxID=1048340 RepID=A0A1H2U865_9BACL|nr:phosphatidate cytidylyltransferase [Marininema mesophilum]SDW52372.1 phosphatidate cytidylyltransferase [Marininema mesophilum]